MFSHDLTKIQTITLHIKQTHKRSNGILYFGCLEKATKEKLHISFGKLKIQTILLQPESTSTETAIHICM